MSNGRGSEAALTGGATLPSLGVTRWAAYIVKNQPLFGSQSLWDSLKPLFAGVRIPNVGVSSDSRAIQDLVRFAMHDATTELDSALPLLEQVKVSGVNVIRGEVARLTGPGDAFTAIDNALALIEANVSETETKITSGKNKQTEGAILGFDTGCILPHQWGWAATLLHTIGEAAFRSSLVSKGFTADEIETIITEGSRAARNLGLSTKP